MVQLAVQLIDRQTSRYDPSDTEDRFETRLRAMIDAKLKGEGLHVEEAPQERSNVVDLMAALKKSLGQIAGKEAATEAAEPRKKTASSSEDVRRQPGLKLPLKGGKGAAASAKSAEPQPAQAAKSSRKRA